MSSVPAEAPATPAPERWVALRPLRHRQFALVWTAALVSNVGTWMETVAVGDLVANRTGEAGWTALVAAAGFLPMGLMGPIGGAIADRVDRRRFLVSTTLLQAACALALAVLTATGRAEPALVALVVFVAGCVAGVGFPAYMSMMPDLVPREDLLGAMSLSQAQFNLGRVVGPALAGLAISLGSYTWAFTLNAVSFAAMLAALRALNLGRVANPSDDGLWARIRAGARAARAEPSVRAAIVMITVVACTASPFIALLPAMARVKFEGGSALTSVFVTSQGVGAVIGALVVPVIAQRIGRHRLLMAGLVALPAALVLYGAAPTAVLATVALAVVGATYMCVFSSIGAVVQARAPVAMRARVLSLYFLALGVAYPVASTVQGPVADRIGLGLMTALSGLALLAAVGVLRLARPSLLDALDYDVEPASDRVVSPEEAEGAG